MQSQRPVGWHAQCGRHVRASGLRQVALTDSVMEGEDEYERRTAQR